MSTNPFPIDAARLAISVAHVWTEEPRLCLLRSSRHGSSIRTFLTTSVLHVLLRLVLNPVAVVASEDFSSLFLQMIALSPDYLLFEISP